MKSRCACVREFLTAATAALGFSLGAAEAAVASGSEAGGIAEIESLLRSELPPDAMEIAAAMKRAKVGETITLRGNVAWSRDAFVANRSLFTLVDESTSLGCCPRSADLPETACAIPAGGRATVQVVDARGRPLRTGLEGRHGLRPGAEVFVIGTVEVANGSTALVVTATALHVPAASLPAALFLAEAPEGARDVAEFRRSARPAAGERVVLRGRIGGSAAPFVDGRAMFTIVGSEIEPCRATAAGPAAEPATAAPDGGCATPWDFCGTAKERLRLGSATIRVADGGGEPLRTALKGRRGMKELSEVIVVGTVTSLEGGGLLVEATGLHVAE
ncbi:MAG TPA: hypothetical protein PKC43_03435 [Phycisphaerales bacterium]|nr:hypothetical protein [Phycisphaerales bacterium]HMP36482.1 hypothetical protein [Phycisphaerales bacterium]